MPPQLKNDILDYVDLDVDVLVHRNFSFQILDIDEFEENAGLFSYPNALRDKVQVALNELIHLINNRIFPFDY